MSIQIVLPYHLGILQRKHTLVIQVRKDKDALSPELLCYLGTTSVSARRLKVNAATSSHILLREYNTRYPGREFRRVVVDTRS